MAMQPLSPSLNSSQLKIESLGESRVVVQTLNGLKSKCKEPIMLRSDSVSTSSLSKDTKATKVSLNGFRRSSSTSNLVVSKATRIQAKLSRSDYLSGRSEGNATDGANDDEEEDEGGSDPWLLTSSTSHLDDFVVSVCKDTIIAVVLISRWLNNFNG